MPMTPALKNSSSTLRLAEEVAALCHGVAPAFDTLFIEGGSLASILAVSSSAFVMRSTITDAVNELCSCAIQTTSTVAISSRPVVAPDRWQQNDWLAAAAASRLIMPMSHRIQEHAVKLTEEADRLVPSLPAFTHRKCLAASNSLRDRVRFLLLRCVGLDKIVVGFRAKLVAICLELFAP
jgi:hypothetical protein